MANYSSDISKVTEELLIVILQNDRNSSFLAQFGEPLNLLEYIILRKISQKSMVIIDLVQGLNISRNIIDTAIRNLMRSDLAAKEQDKSDIRRQVLVLTQKGRDLIKQDEERYRKIVRSSLKDASVNNRSAILEFLNLFAGGLGSEEA